MESGTLSTARLQKLRKMKRKCISRALRYQLYLIGLHQYSLHGHVSNNNTEAVEKVLTDEVGPNILDTDGRGALHVAVTKGYEEMTDLLLRHGANPNITDRYSNTPLHLAACGTNERIIEKLLCAGADSTLLDSNGKMPLQLAERKFELFKSDMRFGIPTESMTILEKIRNIVCILKKEAAKKKEITALEESLKHINIT